MKKSVLLLLVFVFIFSVLGIAQSEKPYEGTTITWVYQEHPTTPLYKHKLEEFEEETGIKVEIVTYPYAELVEKQRVTYSLGKNEFDVGFVPEVATVEWAENGWITALDGFMNDSDLTKDKWVAKDDLFDLALKAHSYEGQLWALPAYTESQVMFYRKDLFEEYNLEVPETWEELLSVCAELEENLEGTNISPIVLRARRERWNAPYIFGNILHGYGADYFNYQNMEPALDTANAIKSAQIFSDLLTKYGPQGPASLNWEDVRTMMVQGTAAITIDASGWASTFEASDSKSAGKLGYAPVPKGPAGRGTGWSTNGLFIPKFSDKKEAAWQFIQWALSPENRLYQVTHGSSYIDRHSVINNPQVVAIHDEFPGFLESLDAGLSSAPDCHYPCSMNAESVAERVGVALSQIMTGQASAEKAMEQANKDIRDMME